MNPIVDICNIDNKIRITDITQDSNEYIPENIQITLPYNQNNKFKYSETCTVNIIQYNSTTEQTIVGTIFSPHCSYLDEAYYTMSKDGYYTITHLILPTTEWLQNELQKEESILDGTMGIYVTDGDKIYHYFNNELNIVESQIMIEINDEDTTISRVSVDTFSICYLYKCYIDLCKQILNNLNIRCIGNNDNLRQETFNRDFLWMSINIIKYHVEFDKLLEAQRLIEKLDKCGSLCSNTALNKISSCGCSQ